jgi:flagellar biosynthesis protein FlhF
MQPTPFIASSAEEAVTQIREKLGPDAVVINVRPLPVNGLARLWQKPMIEVLAYRPELPAPPAAPVPDALAEFRQELEEIKQKVSARPAPDEKVGARQAPNEQADPKEVFAGGGEELNAGCWRVGAVLRKTGMLPLHAQTVLDRLRAQLGENPPQVLGEEINLARTLLSGMWRKPQPLAPRSLHVLVGPAGSGKSTCLCKWLTQAALVEGRLARVWRLDGAAANMAESLSVYCDILGVEHERAWQAGGGLVSEDIGFVDLPGVDWRNPIALKELAGQIKQLGPTHVHLVLNGAYETSILLDQTRAFSALPIEDIVISHLDEEPRWGKVWNLVLGTNYAIRYLSTGQNIPGDFAEATPATLFAGQFCRK